MKPDIGQFTSELILAIANVTNDILVTRREVTVTKGIVHREIVLHDEARNIALVLYVDDVYNGLTEDFSYLDLAEVVVQKFFLAPYSIADLERPCCVVTGPYLILG